VLTVSLERKITALVVDDEELARHVLRELLQAHPEIQVLAECVNGFEAVKAVAEDKPDLILLDVQMPKLTGFDVLELIDTHVAIIFVTAYDQYAMRVSVKKRLPRWNLPLRPVRRSNFSNDWSLKMARGSR
jgi:two-component system LytT family response regulator